MDASPRKQLVDFLASTFEKEGLERFVDLTLDLRDVVDDISFDKSKAEVVHDVVKALESRGCLDGRVFAGLLEERPQRRSEVLILRRAFAGLKARQHGRADDPVRKLIVDYCMLDRVQRRTVRGELRLVSPDPIREWGMASTVTGASGEPDRLAARIDPSRVWAMMIERFSGSLIELYRLVTYVHAHELRLYARVVKGDRELQMDPSIKLGTCIPVPSEAAGPSSMEVDLPTRVGDEVQLALCAVSTQSSPASYGTIEELQAQGGYLLDTAGFLRE